MLDPGLIAAGGGSALTAYLLWRQLRNQKKQQQQKQGNKQGQGGKGQQSQNASGGLGQAGEVPEDLKNGEIVDQTKYVVFDREAKPQSVHFDKQEAVDDWRNKTDSEGSIFDLNTMQNVTPRPDLIKWVKDLIEKLLGHSKPRKLPNLGVKKEEIKSKPLGQSDLRHIKSVIGGRERESGYYLGNTALLMKLVEEINKLDLPVFNIAKKRREKANKLVPIQKRRKRVRKKPMTILEEKTRTVTESKVVPSPFPANDMEVRPIRRVGELGNLARKTDLALPRDLLARRLLQHELPVREYQDECQEERTETYSAPKEIIVDEPYIEEYTDFLEVSDEPTGQLLYTLRDASGSMSGLAAHAAGAMEITIIQRNRENSSRYYDRAFSSGVASRYEGKTPDEKDELVQNIIRNVESDGGTDILNALSVAANEIRRKASTDDQPEILLISDGYDSITAEDIYNIIGEDILLHVVMINSDNPHLKAHASTYVSLSIDGAGNVSVSRGY